MAVSLVTCSLTTTVARGRREPNQTYHTIFYYVTCYHQLQQQEQATQKKIDICNTEYKTKKYLQGHFVPFVEIL